MILDRLFGLETRSKMVVTGAGVGQDATLNRVFGPRPETRSGIEVTEETPLTLSAWYAAVRLLAWTTAYLPLNVYIRKGDGDKELRPKYPLYTLLHDRPNSDMNAMVFRELSLIYTILWGNAYSYIETDRGGTPGALWPLHPRDVIVERNQNRKLFYNISHVEDPPTGKKILAQHEVLHVPGLTLDGVMGKSVVSFAAEHVGEAAAAQQFAAGFYASGAQPNIALKYDGKLDNNPAFAERLRKEWKTKHSNPAAGPAVLEGGMDVANIGVSQADAQYIESRQFTVTEAARWLGVPPHKIGDLLRATFDNITEQNIEFVQALLPWMKRFEQEYNYKLFLPRQRGRYFVEHVPEGLLAGDPEKQNKAFATSLQNGWMTRNEVRKKKNENSMGPQGDIYTVQSNLVPLDRLGELLDAKQVQPEKEEPDDDGDDGDDDEAEDKSTRMLKTALHNTLRQKLREMIHVEARGIQRAAKEPKEFLTRTEKFYKSHEPKLAAAVRTLAEAGAAFDLPVDADAWAAEHCRRSTEALIELSGTVGSSRLAAAVETETKRWETDLPDTLSHLLFPMEDNRE